MEGLIVTDPAGLQTFGDAIVSTSYFYLHASCIQTLQNVKKHRRHSADMPSCKLRSDIGCKTVLHCFSLSLPKFSHPVLFYSGGHDLWERERGS